MHARLLGLIVLGGVALRVAGLDAQSFWRDEASTALELAGGFGDMLDAVHDDEAQPPGYFVLAWLWSKPFGLGEVGLRSLSVVLGVATIPVAAAVGRCWSPRAGLAAAARVAVNPFLVWYSQEARSYALLALLAGLMTLFMVRGRPLAWAVAASAALLTHYFAAFLVLAQAVVLLRRGRSPALALPFAVGLALLPLLISQQDGRVDAIPRESLGARVVDVAKHWTAGPFGTPVDVIGVVAFTLLAAGVALALRRRTGGALAATAAAAVGLPVLAAAAGADYVADRYVIAGLVPLLAVAAAGLAGRWPAVALVAAILAFFSVDAALDERLQREDWRAVAAGLGPSVVAVTPDGDRPLRYYAEGASALGGHAEPAREVVFAASWRFGRERPRTPAPPAPGFTLAGREDGPTTTVVRFRAPEPLAVDPGALSRAWRPDGEAPVLLRVP